MPIAVRPIGGGSARRTRSSRLKIVAGIVLVCGLLLGLDAWRTLQARDDEIARSTVNSANLTRSLAQHTHDSLQAVDAMLVGLRESVEHERLNPSSIARLRLAFASQLSTVPIARNLSVFDVNGDRTLSILAAHSGPLNVADRPFFSYHRDQLDRQTHFGRPVISPFDGAWIITLTRRLDDSEGHFNGVVQATITIEALRQFYRTFDVGRDGVIVLSRSDGIVVVRDPSTVIGKNISSGLIFGKLLPQSPVGNWRVRSMVDGVEHVGSYRTVEGYPFVVVVGLGLDEVLAPWRAEGLFHLLVTLCAALLIAMLGFHFIRRLGFQHRAELELESRERRYRLLAEHSTDLIIQLGPDLLHVYVSPASEPLLQYRPSELMGRHPRHLAHPDDWPALSSHLSSIAQVGHAAPVSYRATRKDGTDVWVEAAIRNLGEGRGFVVVIRDIAQRKEAEAQLRQAQRMEAVGQLTAGVAHDFNNMLQAQLGALELLLDEVAEQPRAAQFATMALAAGEHGAKLTHSLLSFSRQQVLEPEAVAIPTLLGRLERILSRTLGPRISLHFDVEADLVPVFADAAQLEAALLNLALNARDAMPDGGSLSIQSFDASAGADVPDALAPGRHVLIAVSDDGTGMSPETMARACEPFFTTKGVGKGSGLGLSMVQGFARQSGGALRFRDVVPRGTRVELWLPAATVFPPDGAVSQQLAVRGSGLVLLVDDVPEVLTVMAEMLNAAGFDVVAAGSGEDAITRLAECRFDVLVTDFAMAGIDGGELARHVRRSQPWLPVIILTGYAESDRLATVPPDVTIVRKPISGDVLAGRICEVLETTGSRLREPATA